jgi:hypothetical protein
LALLGHPARSLAAFGGKVDIAFRQRLVCFLVEGLLACFEPTGQEYLPRAALSNIDEKVSLSSSHHEVVMVEQLFAAVSLPVS